LRTDYARAAARYGPGQTALVHALSAYNSGGFFAGLSYARGVYATAAGLSLRP
jgi:type IV secretion system protein VirB1